MEMNDLLPVQTCYLTEKVAEQTCDLLMSKLVCFDPTTKAMDVCLAPIIVIQINIK